MSRADLTDARLLRCNLTDANLAHAELLRCDLRDANLSGADLSNARLPLANLIGVNLRQARCSGADLRRARLIAADLDIAALSDADCFGAAMPAAIASTRLNTAVSSACNAVAYSLDDSLIATGHNDNTVRIWDVESGELVATLVNLDEGGAAIWPDGRYSIQGEYAGEFWWTIELCRFEPGELDPYVDHFQRV